MSLYVVNACLTQALLSNPLSYPIAWEGRVVSVDKSQPWIETTLLPSTTDSFQTRERMSGVFQITVHHPLGTGLPIVLQSMDTLASYFVPHSTLTDGSGGVISIRKRYCSPSISEDETINMSLFIHWRHENKFN